ncbi:MAG: protein kinase [Pseudomonadota bacterium]
MGTMTNLLALPSGTVLANDYRIDRVLGAGGFGITYLAQELPLDRLVTIKEYFPSDFAARADQIAASPRSQACAADFQWGLERFIDEAQILARFDHPNICRVYRYFRANATGYMVLQYEHGRSLKAWLKALERSPRQHEIDHIAGPLLNALEVIHASDFLHRDIAPDNIIMRPSGAPVLIDFGAARGALAAGSRTVSALVKPGYSPFEQYGENARQQGPWTDIYSLGATLYQAVTGKRPLDAPSRLAKDELAPAREVAVGAFRPQFLEAIDAALALKATDRPQTVQAWRRMLMAGLAVGGEAQAPTRAPKRAQAQAQMAARAAAPERQAKAPAQAAPAASPNLAGQPTTPHVDVRPAAATPPPADATVHPAGAGPTQPLADRASPVDQRHGAHHAPQRHAAPVPSGQQGDAAAEPAATQVAGTVPRAPSIFAKRRARRKDAAPPAQPKTPAKTPGSKPNAAATRQEAVTQETPAEPANAVATPARATNDAQGQAPGRSTFAGGAPFIALVKRAAAAFKPSKPRAHPQPANATPLPARGAPAGTALAAPELAASPDKAAQPNGRQAASPRVPNPAARANAKAVVPVPARPRRPRRPRVPIGRTLRPLAFKFAIGLAVASVAVMVQQRMPSLESRGRTIAASHQSGLGLLRQIRIHNSQPITGLARTRDGRWLLTTGKDGTLKVWSGLGRHLARTIELDHGPATALAVRNDVVLTGDATGHISLWDLNTGTLKARFRRNEAEIWSLAFAGADDRFASAGHDWAVALWDAGSTAAPNHVFAGHTNAAQAVAFSPRGPYLASGGADRAVKLWNTATLSLVRTYRRMPDFVTALSFTPDGKRIAAATLKGDVRLLSARSSRTRATLRGHRGKVGAMAFSPDGSLLASAGADGTVRLWDVRRGRVRRAIGGHAAGARAVAFGPRGRVLVTGDGEGTLRVWDLSAVLSPTPQKKGS